MAEVFISYSRRDLEFVKALQGRLDQADIASWVDVEGLYAGEEYWPEIAKAIEASVAFLFVISPASIASKVCAAELEHAVKVGKRLVPVCRHETDSEDLHPALAARQWIFFRAKDDPAQAFESLVSAIRADWSELRQQARLLRRAREWSAQDRDRSQLLRGKDLRLAEQWGVRTKGADFGPTPLHSEFIQNSRRDQRRRRTRFLLLTCSALVVIAVVTGFGLRQQVASLNNLSLDAIARGHPNAAIARLQRAGRICSWVSFLGCRHAALNLGKAYLDDGQFAAAQQQLTRLLQSTDQDTADPDFLATVLQNRAFAHIMLAELETVTEVKRGGQYDAAERDLNAAGDWLAKTPASGSGKPTMISRARIDIGRGNYTGALEKLESAGRVSNAADIDLLYSLAFHCLNRGVDSAMHLRNYTAQLKLGLDDPAWKLAKPYYLKVRERCHD